MSLDLHDRDPVRPPVSRRGFLEGVGAAAAAGLFAPNLLASSPAGEDDCDAELGPLGATQRESAAFMQRVSAARKQLLVPTVEHCSNGDEDLYPDRRASYSKGLPHDANGHVDPAAYDSLTAALALGTEAAFEAIQTSAPGAASHFKLVNPQAGLAFDLEGRDSHKFSQPPAPAFASAEEAGEIVENYWMALLRDLPFGEYAGSALAADALADINALSDFKGPKVAGAVTAQTLFRDELAGATLGPYVSQFFWRAQPFGAQFIEPRIRTRVAGLDYMISKPDWLAVESGVKQPAGSYDGALRYIRNGRDLAEWVHIDVLFQAYFQACLILGTPPDAGNPFTGGGIGCPLNPGNPYLASLTQDGFGTLGGPYIKTILCEVATRALKAVWFQKWFVHRRLRPEMFAGRVEHQINHGIPYGIHADALDSDAVSRLQSVNGNCFLPMAFPEGSPLHPAYGAGHATVAGACVTILKYLFDETFVIPDPVQATSDGLALLPYAGPDVLTVGGELNKIASNVATGRNIAGVHWRSDATESLKLGEEVAIALLLDQKATFNESFSVTFARFDGTPVTI